MTTIPPGDEDCGWAVRGCPAERTPRPWRWTAAILCRAEYPITTCHYMNRSAKPQPTGFCVADPRRSCRARLPLATRRDAQGPDTPSSVRALRRWFSLESFMVWLVPNVARSYSILLRRRGVGARPHTRPRPRTRKDGRRFIGVSERPHPGAASGLAWRIAPKGSTPDGSQ